MKTRWFESTVLLFLLILNVILFSQILREKLFYQQGEMTWLNIFWSMDLGSSNPQSLHTGLKGEDVLKPFMTSNVDLLGFRMRQVSSYFDMLSFKFWQYWGVSSFHNYSHILLHVLNGILLGFLVRKLTGSLEAAWLIFVFFLNSAIGISTLLFPFRSAKLLAVTFFLLIWLMVVNEKRPFAQNSFLTKTIVFVLTILILFTDETSFFLLPVIMIYLFLRDGKRGVFNLIMVKYGFAIITTVIILLCSALYLSHKLSPVTPTEHFSLYMGNLRKYLTGMAILKDTFHALAGYFLPRSFGYWDTSFWGATAFVATGVLFYMIFRFKTDMGILKGLSLAIVFVFFLKAFFLPHPGGMHAYIMPDNTIFPSLLFFGYYYPYIDTVFLSLLLCFGLSGVLHKHKKSFLICMTLITFINCSNIKHLYAGVADTVAFHNSALFHPRTALTILLIKDHYKAVKKNGPLYLSFPSGNNPVFIRKILSQYPQTLQEKLVLAFRDYASVIPVMYLRAIEKGDMIISLKNAQPIRPLASDAELASASFFLDVPISKRIDLRPFKERFGVNIFTPHKVNNFQQEISLDTADKEVVFFIKGAAEVNLEAGEKTVKTQQTYGYSYQVFNYPLPKDKKVSLLKINIRSLHEGQPFELIGPFLVPDSLSLGFEVFPDSREKGNKDNGQDDQREVFLYKRQIPEEIPA